jgi:arylsulfatase A-like enzyme
MAESENSIPRPEAAFKGKIGRTAKDSTPDFPKGIEAPKGAPNVLLIMTDDVGFGASSTFGGPVQTPNFQRLADSGLRYNTFHTTALCSPSRAALITGRNHHSVASGVITEMATGFPGYNSLVPKSAGSVGAVLKGNGYNTSWFGKMHNVPDWMSSQAGPFDLWPNGLGFEYFYGFIGGDSDQWHPALFENTTPIEPYLGKPDYILDRDLADKAIKYIRMQHALAPTKPWLVYYATGTAHAPHHAPKDWIAKYKGQFDQGWDKLREETFARQLKLGVVPAGTKLTKRPEQIPAWDSLEPDRKRLYARMMEVYAGALSHADSQIGRLLDELEQSGQRDNTLIIFIMGDNGASPEGTIQGTTDEVAANQGIPESLPFLMSMIDELGGPMTYNHYAVGWAHAMDTPYQWTKQVASHWGGTRNGTIVHWPNGFKAKGEVRTQFTHVIDIAPTVLELAGLPAPAFVNGIQQKPLEGKSMRFAFDDASAPETHDLQYFEMFCNRGIYHRGWTAVTRHSTPWVAAAELPAFDDDAWELYAPDDWTQAHNLAAENPAKLAELQRLFLIEAVKYHVLPLDDRRVERFNSDIAGRPTLVQGKTQLLFGGMGRLTENSVINLKNKSHAVTAEIVVPDGGANGVVIAQGGAFAGWAVYLLEGKPVYCHNLLGLQRFKIAGDTAVPSGTHQIRMELAYDGGGLAKGGDVTIYVDGKQVGAGRVNATVPMVYSGDETCDVGSDIGSSVSDDYTPETSAFTGTVNWVQLDAGDDDQDHLITAEERWQVAMARQ